jgi:hypothetical protein
MNAAGLIFSLKGVVAALEMPFYQSLITDGSVSRGEFEGTHRNFLAVIATLTNMPVEKVEALVAEFNEDLTATYSKFIAIQQSDYIGGFRLAQVMAGYVTTIMAKAGFRG